MIEVVKNSNGLYEFKIKIKGPKKSKTLKGLIDTGSTHCSCTYKVITTLWIRPIDHKPISSINNQPIICPVYIAELMFDKHSIMTEIIRVTNLPENIDFIIGMSVLDQCKLCSSDSRIQIEWK